MTARPSTPSPAPASGAETRCAWCDRPCTHEFCSVDCRQVARDHAPTPPSDAGTSERETAYPLTPELVAKLAAECDRVAEQWAPVAECIEEAKAALANCNPPHSPESDPSGLYYPLLFLVKRLEEYDNAE